MSDTLVGASGGLQFDLRWDSSVGAAPAGFQAALVYAAQQLASIFAAENSGAMTINVDVGWGEVDGAAPSGVAGAVTSTAIVATSQLTALSSIIDPGYSSGWQIPPPPGQLTVSTAQEKSLGLISGSATGVDGYIGFDSQAAYSFELDNLASGQQYNLVGLAENELTAVMGRFSGLTTGDDSIFDMERYSSPGQRALTYDDGSSAYYSVNGGTTDLAGNGLNTQTSNGRLGDWSTAPAFLPDDAFNASPALGAAATLSAVDQELMHTIGYSFASTAPCYCRGTRVLTTRGEVAVEALRVGDIVVTETGRERPVVWLGRRALDCRRHPDPVAVWPVCVRTGAFGEGRPKRDLWLSPGHNIASEGRLMPIRALLNGQSVFQQQRATVEYWHVELDAHDVIHAEGLPAESYLDTGNRTGFVNGGAFLEAHPDFEPRHWAQTCLPLVSDGAEVERTRAALIARLGQFGVEITTDADLHLEVDGERVEPFALGARRLCFVVAPDRQDIRLVSRSFTPAHTQPGNCDARTLGVCVSRLQIDGEEVALDDAEPFASGWNAWERANAAAPGLRWTTGDTPLPRGVRLVVVELAGDGHYWREIDGKGAPVNQLRPSYA